MKRPQKICMPELPGYVTSTRRVVATVETPEGKNKTFSSTNDYIQFIDVRPDGVWIRNEDQINRFYPEHRVLELEMDSNADELPEDLQRQRRK